MVLNIDAIVFAVRTPTHAVLLVYCFKQSAVGQGYPPNSPARRYVIQRLSHDGHRHERPVGGRPSTQSHHTLHLDDQLLHFKRFAYVAIETRGVELLLVSLYGIRSERNHRQVGIGDLLSDA